MGNRSLKKWKQIYKTGELSPWHYCVLVLSYVLDLELVSKLGNTKTKSSMVVNMLSKCFGSAFSEYCIIAKQE